MSEPIDTSTAAFIERARVMALPSHNALRAQLSGGTVSREEVIAAIHGGSWVQGKHYMDVRVKEFIADALMPLFVRERVAGAAEQRDKFSIDSAHLLRQHSFSQQTFGPGSRLAGVLDHIRKELVEVEAEPQDMSEWADLVILAFDGALRQGHDPQKLLDAIQAKQTKNEGRVWPDWRTQPADRAIEHVRESPACFCDPRPNMDCPIHGNDSGPIRGGNTNE